MQRRRTRKEVEILKEKVVSLRCRGMTVSDIAQELGVARGVVSHHLHRASVDGAELPDVVTDTRGKVIKTRNRAPGLCRHCQKGPAHYPRGLCLHCYKDPTIRRGHSSRDDVSSRRGLGLSGPAKAPQQPCADPPGSPGKVDALCRRAAAGVGLWHSGDSR